MTGASTGVLVIWGQFVIPVGPPPGPPLEPGDPGVKWLFLVASLLLTVLIWPCWSEASRREREGKPGGSPDAAVGGCVTLALWFGALPLVALFWFGTIREFLGFHAGK